MEFWVVGNLGWPPCDVGSPVFKEGRPPPPCCCDDKIPPSGGCCCGRLLPPFPLGISPSPAPTPDPYELIS